MAETKQWAWLIVVALVFSVGTYSLFPQTIDETDYSYGDNFALQVESLEADLNVLTADNEAVTAEKETISAELDAALISWADSESELTALRELPQEQFSFGDWILGLLGDAEDDAELTYNGVLYEGEDGEWDLDARDSEDIDARDCDIVFDDKDFGEEMTLECSDIRLETEDDDDILCDFEILIDGNEYDEAVITNCVLN
jgi:hypothetical protein